jgi:CrcB protein
MTAPLWLAVGGLGGLGAIVRFVLDGAIGERVASAFPWGTFVVNMSGSLLLGLLAGAALHGDALLLAGTATLGSYTTFSTWMLETVRLAEDGLGRLASWNLVASLGVGIGAIELGHLIGGLL